MDNAIDQQVTTRPECLQFPAGSHRRAICDGTAALSLAKVNAYRRRWGLHELTAVERPEVPARPVIHAGTPPPPRKQRTASVSSCGSCSGTPSRVPSDTSPVPQGGPGTELQRRWAEQGYPHCDACTALARQMDRWGAYECRQRLEQIVADILPRAQQWVAEQRPWVAGLLRLSHLSAAVITRVITQEVLAAIATAEQQCAVHVQLPPPPQSVRRVVIMAGGAAQRWAGACPKQLAQVDGEPILYRTIRLLRERGIEPEVSARYRDQWPGLRTHLAPAQEHQIDRLLNSAEFAPALYLYGDCYYSEAALEQILSTGGDWCFFGRRGGSQVKPHGEIFAFVANAYVLDKARQLKADHAAGRITHSLGWDLYHRCVGSRYSTNPPPHPRFVDLTGCEDFDTLTEYETFLASSWSSTFQPISTTPEDVEQQCQLIVKSFRRHDCLARLIDSVHARYPRLSILVADDSFRDEEPLPEIAQELRSRPYVDWHALPFDRGLSAGRNHLVQVATAEYLLLCDDDFVCTDQTRFERLLHVLLHDQSLTLCAGLVDFVKQSSNNWSGSFERLTRKRGWRMRPLGVEHPVRIVNGVQVRDTDLALNFFAARRSSLLRVPWDEHYKIGGEHLDFFLTRTVAGERSAYTPEVRIGHTPESPGDYADWRRRDTQFRQQLQRKWGDCQTRPMHLEVLRE